MARALHPPIAARLGDVSTERLDMLCLRPEHAEALTPIFAEPAVWEFPYGRGLTAQETDAVARRRAEEWRDKGFGCWLLVERATGRALGYAGLIVPVLFGPRFGVVEPGVGELIRQKSFALSDVADEGTEVGAALRTGGYGAGSAKGHLLTTVAP